MSALMSLLYHHSNLNIPMHSRTGRRLNTRCLHLYALLSSPFARAHHRRQCIISAASELTVPFSLANEMGQRIQEGRM